MAGIAGADLAAAAATDSVAATAVAAACVVGLAEASFAPEMWVAAAVAFAEDVDSEVAFAAEDLSERPCSSGPAVGVVASVDWLRFHPAVVAAVAAASALVALGSAALAAAALAVEDFDLLVVVGLALAASSDRVVEVAAAHLVADPEVVVVALEAAGLADPESVVDWIADPAVAAAFGVAVLGSAASGALEAAELVLVAPEPECFEAADFAADFVAVVELED